jgi:protein-disulfide isomerase
VKIRLIMATLMGVLTSATAFAVPAATTAPAATPAPVTLAANDTQKKQIETVVHDYIIGNPEVVVQSLQNFQQKQMDQAQKMMDKTRQLAPKFATDIFKKANDPMAGNPNGKITLVEFFDYQCPHCTHMKPVLEDMIKANPDLRVVYKEFPIRGPVSEAASKAALAAKNQGKYNELHNVLMDMASKGPLTEEIIYSSATTAGLDVNKLKADMQSPAITDQIKANMNLGKNLILMGTPAFFIAKSYVKPIGNPDTIAFIPGFVDSGNLQVIITQISKQ